VRDLDSLAARPLPDSEKAENPFWSPESRFFDISADARRFLLVNLPDQTAGTPMTVVIHWNASAKK
jgi:hypothetical protein